ncbi:hypothetical protein RI844_06955 [Thalassotalea fonticola]|uniref:Tetratricopeptide repeat protein n=1 Tax=Thalassotalea fonticola TaxID=3065649 RepID=A0ABZ0GT55_9GAMM|nr:hypothetical protein RI844_06955 [Colwelliaceae bacterium S1-1]
MNFIKKLSVTPLSRKGMFTALMLSTLAACSSAPEQASSAGAAAQNTAARTNAATTPELSEVDAERQRILAMPNRYKENAAAVPNEVKLAVEAALTQKANGDIDGAKASLKVINANHPSLSGIALQLGDIALTSGDTALAKAYYQQAISANNNNYYAHNRLGNLQRKSGEFASAKASYLAALTSYAGFAEANLNLGILLDMYMGKKEQALAYYQTYQVLTKQENRKVKGWIADISMQLRAVNNG